MSGGVVTAPNSVASAVRAISRVASGNGVPYFSKGREPDLTVAKLELERRMPFRDHFEHPYRLAGDLSADPVAAENGESHSSSSMSCSRT